MSYHSYKTLSASSLRWLSHRTCVVVGVIVGVIIISNHILTRLLDTIIYVFLPVCIYQFMVKTFMLRLFTFLYISVTLYYIVDYTVDASTWFINYVKNGYGSKNVE